MDYPYEYPLPSPKRKIIRENNCVRRIRFSTTLETTADDNDSIKVYARIKPAVNKEDDFIEFDSSTIGYKELDKRGCLKIMKYSFHKVFSPRINQKVLFEETLDHEIDHFIKGEDRLLFAYGTTGSGKTYTILGTNRNPGILARCTMKLYIALNGMTVDTQYCPDQGNDIRKMSDDEYQMISDVKEYIMSHVEGSDAKGKEDSFNCNGKDLMNLVNLLLEETDGRNSMDLHEDTKYSVWISYLEIYNENIYDLFDITGTRTPLKIGYDSKKNNYVRGLTHINVVEWHELWKVFIYGRRQLHTNETLLNKSSSRSHSVFTVKLLKLSKDNITSSSLSICDLAGCERQKKTNNEGSKLKESRSINFSLMVLNRCFATVRENNVKVTKKIAPYRDSKLTLIFQKAFSYGEHITMIVNISRSSILAEETKNILKMSAVAQEMMKPIPKIQEIFLKPQCRFSMMCANPNEPFFSQKAHGVSGVMTLSTSTAASNSLLEESNRINEAKIKSLEEENQKKDEKNKELSEMLEDARAEYLNLETKYKEVQSDLAAEEGAHEDLQRDYDDCMILYDVAIGNVKIVSASHDKDVETIANLNKEVADLNNEVADLNKEIAELREELDKFKLSANIAKPKGRQLLSAMVHLEVPSPLPEPLRENNNGISMRDDSGACCNVLKTPNSVRKGKKLDFFDGFEELPQPRSVRKSARKVNKPQHYLE